MPWDVESILVDNKPLATTGGRVWDAARACAQFLSQTGMYHDILSRPGARLLELGAGCGWLGLAITNNVAKDTAELVCLTERAEGGGLAHLECNLLLNSGSSRSNLVTAELDWVEVTKEEKTAIPLRIRRSTCATYSPFDQAATFVDTDQMVDRWDFIFGSDLVYEEKAGVVALSRLLRKLLLRVDTTSPRPTALYAHTKRRFEHLDMLFYRELARQGLKVKEVFHTEGQKRPTSPPPMLERLEMGWDPNFPDMRVAMLEITAADDGEEVVPYDLKVLENVGMML